LAAAARIPSACGASPFERPRALEDKADFVIDSLMRESVQMTKVPTLAPPQT
jgi:hypothetical protein